MKRIISVFITVVLLVAIIIVPGVNASAADIETGTLVTFGSYPQSMVTDSALIKTLNTKSLNWKYYDYYCDGKQEDFMKYADVTYSGNRYRAVTFSHYRPYSSSYSSDSIYTYQDENGYEPNIVYWFKYEPLVWRILDFNIGFMMTERIIDNRIFNFGHHDDNSDGIIDHYESNWAYSSLRTWMNDKFYNTAFNVEKDYIKTTPLITPSSFSSIYDADVTIDDKIFILSREDVLNRSYGFSADPNSEDWHKIAYGTDYAKCQGIYVALLPGTFYNGASFWRLRTPIRESGSDYVDYDGYVTHRSIPGACAGIRPALNVNLQDASSKGVIKRIDEADLTVLKGDIDGNGQILAEDARLALRASAGLHKLTDTQKLAADVNEDGKVLADDARQILRYSAKLQTSFTKA